MGIFGRVSKPYWDDRPVAVIGGGGSFKDFDLEKLRGCHVLAVKGAILNVPWADACFGMGEYPDWLPNVQCRVYWAVEGDHEAGPTKNVTLLKRLQGVAVADHPGEVYGGHTSGFAALQICIHKRAKQIVLFGYDYDRWPQWAESFTAYSPHFTKHGVSVANASPASEIRCFQKVGLHDGANMVQPQWTT
jgi:hypothetical protein